MSNGDMKLNKDRECPKCGDREFKVIGSPAKVIDSTGTELRAPVGYGKVVECKSCRQIRGK